MNAIQGLIIVWLLLGVLSIFLRVVNAWLVLTLAGLAALLPAAAIKVLFFM